MDKARVDSGVFEESGRFGEEVEVLVDCLARLSHGTKAEIVGKAFEKYTNEDSFPIGPVQATIAGFGEKLGLPSQIARYEEGLLKTWGWKYIKGAVVEVLGGPERKPEAMTFLTELKRQSESRPNIGTGLSMLGMELSGKLVKHN